MVEKVGLDSIQQNFRNAQKIGEAEIQTDGQFRREISAKDWTTEMDEIEQRCVVTFLWKEGIDAVKFNSD
jgi:hypothetical protein